MVRLDDVQIFVQVAEQGGFTAASKSLEISPAVASVAIKRLEQSLNTALFVRTTRSLSMTEAGQLYLEHAKSALQAIKQGEAAIALNQGDINGRLSVSVPSDLGRGMLRIALNAFQRLHPNLTIKSMPSDRIFDLYKMPVDVAIRYGTPGDSSLYAIPLVSDNYRVVCASPEYFKQYGQPQRPEDLSHHQCLCFMLNDVVHNKWQFGTTDDKQIVTVSGKKVSDDGDMVRQWAVDGEGIAYKSRLDVLGDVRAGRLMLALEDYTTEPVPLHFITAQRVSTMPAAHALLDYLNSTFKDYLVNT